MTFSSELLLTVKQLAKDLLPDIISVRRHLHQYPELSFEEVKTSEFICDQLDKHGISYRKGWAGYGIVADIKVNNASKLIALRADMDALPIQEANDVEYKSIFSDVMHACGHDVHMASLLGTAFILQKLKDQLPYSIRLIFQPGEEKLPGGANLMIREGVLKNPIPASIIGQHVFPSLPAGKVGIRSGLYMASADEIFITVSGKGGHGGMPNECTDTVLAASQMIVSLQQVVSRRTNPATPSVLSFGKFNTEGGATNIIPDVIRIEGTFRTMDEVWRQRAHELITNIATDICKTYGTHCEVNIIKGYPCLINQPDLTINVQEIMVQFLGSENVVELPLRMTSEDFAFYSQVIPACFYRLGTGNPQKEINSAVHTSTFDIDENALAVGMGLMAWIAINQ
ncbi:MAG: amidohydrolase [Saprospiraceae bacterium]|nr:amidohydrolase [Saprospiraceae bacterium]MBL0026669.1 amidohydrolase [Saprospiraceae bacterium]